MYTHRTARLSTQSDVDKDTSLPPLYICDVTSSMFHPHNGPGIYEDMGGPSLIRRRYPSPVPLSHIKTVTARTRSEITKHTPLLNELHAELCSGVVCSEQKQKKRGEGNRKGTRVPFTLTLFIYCCVLYAEKKHEEGEKTQINCLGLFTAKLSTTLTNLSNKITVR
jgi:hypothetical protein